MSEFIKRLAVTLAALAIYRLGLQLPLPGIAPETLVALLGPADSPRAAEAISIFALDITPIIHALLLLEAFRLLSGRFNNFVQFSPGNARLVERGVIVGALLLAVVQGIGLSHTFEEAEYVAADPGPGFRFPLTATLVASTALLIWLMGLISRRGIGNGIWVLLAAPHLALLPELASAWLTGVQSGFMSAGSVVAVCVYAIAAVACVAALARPVAAAGLPLDRVFIWPLFIANWMAGLLLSASAIIPPGRAQEVATNLLSLNSPVFLAAFAVIVVLISLEQWRRLLGQAPVPAAAPRLHGEGALPIVLTALVLAGLSVIPHLLRIYLDLPVVIDGAVIAAMVMIALTIQQMLRRR